jgi:transcriptional regulator with XRE-family HTH domain
LNWKEIIERLFFLYQVKTQEDLGRRLLVSQDLVSKWMRGMTRPTWDLMARVVLETGCSWEWLLAGKSGDAPAGRLITEILAAHPGSPSALPPDNALPPRANGPVDFVLHAGAIPVVGEAAADETRGRKAGFLPPDPEARYDELHFPETTAAVRIIGDSMAPVLLGGQYALIGPEYLGNFDRPGDHDIVVVDVGIRDDVRGASDARWTGTYCKRVVDGGEVWFFLSVNPVGVPFTVAKANCRLWPVIGVWFAGKGEPPED